MHWMCVPSCQPVVVAKSSSGRAREDKSSLSTACHSPPNRPKLVAAPYRGNLSRGPKTCGAANWRVAQASLQLLHCWNPPLLSCNLAIWSVRHLLAVRGSNRVHTGITSAGSALCTKMPPRHIHQNAQCSHQNPQMDKCRTVFP